MCATVRFIYLFCFHLSHILFIFLYKRGRGKRFKIYNAAMSRLGLIRYGARAARAMRERHVRQPAAASQPPDHYYRYCIQNN